MNDKRDTFSLDCGQLSGCEQRGGDRQGYKNSFPVRLPAAQFYLRQQIFVIVPEFGPSLSAKTYSTIREGQ